MAAPLLLDEIRKALLGGGDSPYPPAENIGAPQPAGQGVPVPPQPQFEEPRTMEDLQARQAEQQAYESAAAIPNPNKPILDLGVDDFDLDPEKVSKAGIGQEQLNQGLNAVKAITHGQQMMDVVNKKRQSGQDTTAEESWMSKIGEGVKGMFGNEERLLGMALAFNTLRFQPDQGLAASLGSRIKTLQEQRLVQSQNQQLMPYLEKNYPQFAPLAKMGLMSAKEIMTLATKNPTQLNQILEMMKTPEGRKQIEDLKAVGYNLGGGTNITMKGDQKYTEANATDLVKMKNKIYESAENSWSSMQSINRFISQAAGLDTGKGAEWKQTFREYAEGLGLPVDEAALADAQSIDAAAGQIVINELRKNKGPQTAADQEFQQKITVGLGKTPEANKRIADYLQSIDKINIAIADTLDANLTGKYEDDSTYVTRLNRVKRKVPAVGKNSRGQWMMFSTFYDKVRAADPSKTDREIINGWLKQTGTDLEL